MKWVFDYTLKYAWKIKRKDVGVGKASIVNRSFHAFL